MQKTSGGMPSLIGGMSEQPAEIRRPDQVDQLLNCVCTPSQGLQSRTAFRLLDELFVSDLGSAPFVHQFDDGDGQAWALIVFDAIAGKPLDIRVAKLTDDGECMMVPVTSEIDGIADARNYLSSLDVVGALRAVTVQDTTWIANKDRVIAGSNLYDAPQANPAVIFWKGSGFGQKYVLKVTSQGQTHVWSAQICDQPIQSAPPNFSLSTSYAADAFEHLLLGSVDGQPLRVEEQDFTPNGVDIKANPGLVKKGPNITFPENAGLAAGKGFTVERPKGGSRLIIRPDQGTDIEVVVEDGQGGTYMKVAHKSVAKDTDLPAQAADGMIIQVAGDPSATVDDFWLKYTTAGGWSQTVKPGERYAFDKNTTPVQLVKDGDGWRIVYNPLEVRLCGDAVTNKPVSFLGQSLRDVSFYKNRLVFITSTAVIMSEIGFYENFWRTTVQEIKDSDPIDADVAFPGFYNLDWIVPFDRQLFLISSSAQFMVSGEPLSKKTIAITAVSKHVLDPRTKPVTTAESIFWMATDTGQSRLVEYYPFADRAGGYTADDVTEHVPGIMGKGHTDTAIFPAQRMFFGLHRRYEESGSYLACYQWYNQGGERKQSAWGLWFMGFSVKALIATKHHLYAIASLEDNVPGGGLAPNNSRTFMLSNDLRQETNDRVEGDETFSLRMDLRMEHDSVNHKYRETGRPWSYSVLENGDVRLDFPWKISLDRIEDGRRVTAVRMRGNLKGVTITPKSRGESFEIYPADQCIDGIAAGIGCSGLVRFPRLFVRGQDGGEEIGNELQLRGLTVTAQGPLTNVGDQRGTTRLPAAALVTWGGIDSPYARPLRYSNGFRTVDTARVNLQVDARVARLSIAFGGAMPTAIRQMQWDGIVKPTQKI